MIELRDYQEESLRLVVESYQRASNNSEIIVLPCSAGKTIIFSQVIDTLKKLAGVVSLVIAHRDELLDQAAEKYRMVKPDAIIGKVGNGVHQYGGEVTVANIATVSQPSHIKRLQALYGTGKRLLIIVDEAHHVAADGYQRVLEALPDAFKLFVTATPKRLDGKEILDKPPLLERSIIEMIKRKWLTDVKAIAIKTEVDLSKLKSRMGDFQQEELSNAVDTPARNNLIVQKYKEHTPGKRAVAFCVTVAHAEHLAQAFNEAGIKAEMIEGNTTTEERKAIYKRFHAGITLILTNVMVLTEGWDEPLCEVGIGARPTQSWALFIQMLGRILRLAPGKRFATWLDITDNCFNHKLAPQSLSKALGKFIKNDETVLQMEEREAQESAERKAQVRKLQVSRLEDLHVNLLETLSWKTLENGLFLLEVGAERHRIALAENDDGTYDVWARLFPGYEAQSWAENLPLDYAQQLAERNARKILSNPKAAKWLDKTDPYRSNPPSENQIKFLKWKKIPYDETLTFV